MQSDAASCAMALVVSLIEALEDTFLVFIGYALSAVRDNNLDIVVVVFEQYADSAIIWRKLESVAQNVVHYLIYLLRIDDNI